MGKFKQNTVNLRQLYAGIYELLTNVEYVTNERRYIKVPKGFVTDGYSKPQITEAFVGGRFEDNILPAILHDYLCYHKGYYDEWDEYIPLDFNKVNNIFHEAMLAVKINPIKALMMRIAVQFNPKRW